MFNKLIEKLRAIPAVGIVRQVTYFGAGATRREYSPLCFLVDYDGVEQVMSVASSSMAAFKKRSIEKGLIDSHPTTKLGKLVKRQYTNKRGSYEQVVNCWTVLVKQDRCSYVLTLSDGDLRNGISYGLKLSQQLKCRASWFARLIRAVGLFIFDW